MAKVAVMFPQATRTDLLCRIAAMQAAD